MAKVNTYVAQATRAQLSGLKDSFKESKLAYTLAKTKAEKSKAAKEMDDIGREIARLQSVLK